MKLITTKAIPDELREIIPIESFKKSIEYSKDKFSFGIFQSIIMFSEAMVLTFCGYLPFCWDISNSQSRKLGLINDQSSELYSEIIITLGFVTILSMHDLIISLPFTLYKTFVIEEKHGFNKNTLALFFRDLIMQIVLGFIIGSPILAGIIWLIKLSGPYYYIYVWLFLCIVSIFMMTIYPTLIAPLFNKYTKLDSGEVYDAVEALAKKVAFPLTQLYVVDGSRRSSHSNAYFYGFFKVISTFFIITFLLLILLIFIIFI